MRRTPLTDGWTCEVGGDTVPADLRGVSVPATVPGYGHLDLLAAGLVPHPYTGLGEQQLAWAHRADWTFRRPLHPAPAADGEHVELLFEGIDTVARVTADGVERGRSRDMHRSLRLDVTDLADGGEHAVAVEITSATRYAEAERQRLGDRPGPYAAPFPFVRTMACSFGWDWGPDLRAAGLWRPVHEIRWRTARLDPVRPLVALRGLDGDRAEQAVVTVEVDVVRSDRVAPRPLRLTASVAGITGTAEIVAGSTHAVLELVVPDPALWWPVGYGEQPLHALDVVLTGDDGELDSWSQRIGLRSVRVDTTPDEHGTPFVLHVNERPVFVKGANWIPDDHFVGTVTESALARRLDQAVDAHLNLLRVWGGGIHESDTFYRLADERGLMVWQDFLLACAAYPEDEPPASELAAEAAENVVRLLPHPSLVIWNGGNENLWGHEDWGWKEQLGELSWGEHYARELLPGIVSRLDPSRPYSENSPSSPDPARHPNDPDHGTHHQWEVWNRVDLRGYTEEVPRFCSEFGYQGPPTWRTLADAVPAADGRPLEHADDPKNDPVWLLHQKAEDGNAKLDGGMAPHVGVPADFTDWLWAAQLVQARAVRTGVDHYRSWWPRTAGAIVWQLNDCWPVTSWSVIDGAGRRKPAWYALRAAMAPHRLVVGEREGGPVLSLVNDSDAAWAGTLQLHRETLAGARTASHSTGVDVAPRSVTTLPLPAELAGGLGPDEVLLAELGSPSGPVLLAHRAHTDVGSALRPDAAAVAVDRTAEGYRLTVTARSLVCDLTVMVDRVDPDGEVSDGLVTVPAGRTAVLEVRCRELADPTVLTRRPVLRTANDLRGVPQDLRPVRPAARHLGPPPHPVAVP